MTKLLTIISFLFLLISCKKSREIDTYKIYNTVLKEKISTYGIMVNYFPYDRDYSEKEREIFAEKTKDSLIKTKSLTYFLSKQLTVLDTLNSGDEFRNDTNILMIDFKPNISKNKLDFSKLKKLEIGSRLEKERAIDENQKKPTYLGSYSLSEPIFISAEKAVIRYEHHCGGKCGLSLLIYLKKEKNSWKIIDEKMVWIS